MKDRIIGPKPEDLSFIGSFGLLIGLITLLLAEALLLDPIIGHKPTIIPTQTATATRAPILPTATIFAYSPSPTPSLP